MGEYLSAGLHTFYCCPDRAALVDHQRHLGCPNGHRLRIGCLLRIPAGDGVDRGAGLSDVGLVFDAGQTLIA